MQQALVTRSEKAINSRYDKQFVGIACASAPPISSAGATKSIRITRGPVLPIFFLYSCLSPALSLPYGARASTRGNCWRCKRLSA
jgi:hypothetical protein